MEVTSNDYEDSVLLVLRHSDGVYGLLGLVKCWSGVVE